MKMPALFLPLIYCVFGIFVVFNCGNLMNGLWTLSVILYVGKCERRETKSDIANAFMSYN